MITAVPNSLAPTVVWQNMTVSFELNITNSGTSDLTLNTSSTISFVDRFGESYVANLSTLTNVPANQVVSLNFTRAWISNNFYPYDTYVPCLSLLGNLTGGMSYSQILLAVNNSIVFDLSKGKLGVGITPGSGTWNFTQNGGYLQFRVSGGPEVGRNITMSWRGNASNLNVEFYPSGTFFVRAGAFASVYARILPGPSAEYCKPYYHEVLATIEIPAPGGIGMGGESSAVAELWTAFNPVSPPQVRIDLVQTNQSLYLAGLPFTVRVTAFNVGSNEALINETLTTLRFFSDGEDVSSMFATRIVSAPPLAPGSSGEITFEVSPRLDARQLEVTIDPTISTYVIYRNAYVFVPDPVAPPTHLMLSNSSTGSSCDPPRVAVVKLGHSLSVISPYGNASGAGSYEHGTSALFQVTPSTIDMGNGTRRVLIGWLGLGAGGYNGTNNPASVVLTDNVKQIAIWKTQYYLNATSQFGNVTGGGWVDAGSTATVSVLSRTIQVGEGVRATFKGWNVSGLYQEISLAAIGNQPATFPELIGNVVLGGVPFHIDAGPTAIFVTQGQGGETVHLPTEGTVHIGKESVEVVYLVFCAGWAAGTDPGFINVTLGTVELTFDDGSTILVELRDGFNIRNSFLADVYHPGYKSLTAPNAVEVFRRDVEDGYCVLDMLAIEIPEAEQHKVLVSITLRDLVTGYTGGSCILLNGITVRRDLRPLNDTAGSLEVTRPATVKANWELEYQIRVIQSWSSEFLLNVGSSTTVYFRLVRKCDELPFSAANGSVWIAGQVSVWDDVEKAWKLEAASQDVGGLSYSVTSVECSKYRVYDVEDVVGPVHVVWTELRLSDVICSPAAVVNAGTSVMLYAKVIWAHNASAVPGSLVTLNGTLNGFTNNTGWTMFTIPSQDTIRELVYVIQPASDLTGSITRGLAKTVRVTWTGLTVSDVRADRTIADIGSSIDLLVRVTWMHNGSVSQGSDVCLNGSLTLLGVTNSSGWARISVFSDSLGCSVYRAEALRDATGFVTGSGSLLSPSLVWTALNVTYASPDTRLTSTNSTVKVTTRIVWAHNGSAAVNAVVSLRGNLSSYEAFTNSTGFAEFSVSENMAGDYLYVVSGKWACGVTSSLENRTIRIRFGVGRSVPIDLRRGYNLVSLPLLNESLTASKLLGLIGDAAQSVFFFNSSSQTYVSYDKKLAEFGICQDDFQIMPDVGYFVYVSARVTVNLTGTTQEGRRSLHVKVRYNLIGWTCDRVANASTLVAAGNGKISAVFWFNASSQGWESYDVSLQQFGIRQTDFRVLPGMGVFVFVSEDTEVDFGEQ